MWSVQDGVTAPLYKERDELKSRLMAAEEALRATAAKVENVTEERTQLQYQVKRLDERLIAKDKCAFNIHGPFETLNMCGGLVYTQLNAVSHGFSCHSPSHLQGLFNTGRENVATG